MAGRSPQADLNRRRGLARRLLAAALLAAGAVLLAYTLQQGVEAPRRSAAAAALLVGGIALNVVSAARRHLPVRAWLRNLACAVGGVLLIGVLGLRYHVRESVLPTVPDADLPLRLALLAWQRMLLWLSIGVGYVVLSMVVLPRAQGASQDATPSSVSVSESAPESEPPTHA